MMCQRIGRPPISIIGFGRSADSSERRGPMPPARMMAFKARCSPLRLAISDRCYQHIDHGMYYLTQTNPFVFRPQTDENFYPVGPDRLVKVQMQADENGRNGMRYFQAGNPKTAVHAFFKSNDRFEIDS